MTKHIDIKYQGFTATVHYSISGHDKYYGVHHPDNEESICDIKKVVIFGHDAKQAIDNNGDWEYIKELLYEELDRQS